MAAAEAAREERAPWERHERAWRAFEAGPPDAFTVADVPWPTLNAKALGLEGKSSSAAQRKAAFRAASLRWHPDKFLQSYGARLRPDERETILQKVTEVAQAINSLYQET